MAPATKEQIQARKDRALEAGRRIYLAQIKRFTKMALTPEQFAAVKDILDTLLDKIERAYPGDPNYLFKIAQEITWQMLRIQVPPPAVKKKLKV